ncbi:MAG TPA: 2OG-Fe(II) oxygenase [Burkholderiales bacterium]|jgi:SM-20-related protein|nr:2OG-Fe(II) oxygenase [Burkholderiales bacterium]
MIDARETAQFAESLAEDIATAGYSIRAGFIDEEELAALRAALLSLQAVGRFRPAGVGKSAEVCGTERSDRIAWLDPEHASPGVSAVLARFEALRLVLNRRLFLGLFELECHFAHYPPGAFYRRHLDQLRGDSRRALTCVLYLNDAWRAEDGGALRIYLDLEGRALDVMPQGGRLVCLLSDRFEHEVLPAQRDRWSLTGWFRRR